jgi:hypothetical protein
MVLSVGIHRGGQRQGRHVVDEQRVKLERVGWLNVDSHDPSRSRHEG